MCFMSSISNTCLIRALICNMNSRCKKFCNLNIAIESTYLGHCTIVGTNLSVPRQKSKSRESERLKWVADKEGYTVYIIKKIS